MEEKVTSNPGLKTEKGSTLLLEIGTEEIPARFLPGVIAQMKMLAEDLLNENRIGFNRIRCYATPRRTALIIEGLPERQEGFSEVVFGPPRSVAFDSEGNPTRAVIGFAQSQGVAVESLQVEKKGKGEYLVAVVEGKGRPVREALPDVLKRLLLSIHFPKSMRWGSGDMRFARPIHWILSVMDDVVVPLEAGGISSDRWTRGHRFLSPDKVEIGDIDEYLNTLEKRYVFVDHEKRREIIRKEVLRLSEEAGGLPVEDEELLEAVTFLVEYPAAVLCTFSDGYLGLPGELLITVMKDHQKYFAVKKSDGGLLSRFIVISNTTPENAGVVRRGAERVIKARFDDARFYYEDDLKVSLAGRLEKLRRVTFHDRLGSLYEKVQRVLKVADALSVLAPESAGNTHRAALLCKSDLVTGVVREFPELQGLMGRYYALHDGEDPEVAEAIREHYMPVHAGGELPTTHTGAIVGIADRIDNILNFFSIGLKPTGSEDPFALRRQALGIISILLGKGYRMGIEHLITTSLNVLDLTDENLSGDVLGFFMQRLEPLFSSEGYPFDVIQSVLIRAKDTPLTELKRIMATAVSFKDEPYYNETLLAFKRVFNILKDKTTGEVSQKLLGLKEETGLYSAAAKLDESLREVLREGDYMMALQLLSELRGHINIFFDNVLVMDEDMEIRQNRLNLLGIIRKTVINLLDITRLQES